MTKKLAPKQQRFVEEYLVDLNGTQAAIRAGYSAKTAYSIADGLLRKHEIQAAITERTRVRCERTEITQDYVLSRLASIVERCMQHEPVLDRRGEQVVVNTPAGQLAAAFQFTPGPATRALELLGKHVGLFGDKAAADAFADMAAVMRREAERQALFPNGNGKGG